jgi:hypothetical protein
MHPHRWLQGSVAGFCTIRPKSILALTRKTIPPDKAERLYWQ